MRWNNNASIVFSFHHDIQNRDYSISQLEIKYYLVGKCFCIFCYKRLSLTYSAVTTNVI